MTKSLKDMLVGVILGDAYIKKTDIHKAFISFEQSINKIKYFKYLHSIIKQEGLLLIDENIREYIRKDLRHNVVKKSLYFRTHSLEELKPLADLFLNELEKKTIPKDIANYLTPRSLAFWIMDDGQQVKKGGITLCTDSFTSEEINILREALFKNFNLETTIHIKKGKNKVQYERIYIKKNTFEEFKPF